MVYLALFFFSITLALKLDNVFNYSFYAAFSPLWIAEIIIFLGFIVGFFNFFWKPPSRTDIVSRNEFLAMILCFCEHCLLTGFALFCSFKLEIQGSQIDKQLSWLLLFSPLFILSFFCMIVAVWAIRHDRTFDVSLKNV